MTRTVGRSAAVASCVAMLALSACAGSSTGGSDASRTSPASSPSGSSHDTSSPPSSETAQPAATEVNPPGDIPDDQVFVRYHLPGANVTIKVPEGWARSSTGGAVTFTDKLNSITITASPQSSRPTVSSVRSTELLAVAQQGRNYKFRTVKVAHLTSGSAVLATYLQDSASDPVTNKVVRDEVERFSFWLGGTEAVLTLSGPKGSDNVDPWRIVSESLTWR